MSPEKQRIAIAEACDLKDIRGPRGYAFDGPHYLVASSQMGAIRRLIPDYPNDLNAMHEAEKALAENQKIEYAKNLMGIVRSGFGHCTDDLFYFAHATAAQRAEAFLRTIGKWEEGT